MRSKDRRESSRSWGWGPCRYDLEYPFGAGTYYDVSFYLPEETYLQMGGNPGAMTVGIEAEEGEERKHWENGWKTI